VTDLRIDQVGHGLGPRDFGGNRATLSYDRSVLTKILKLCEAAQRYNFTIYFETSGNALIRTVTTTQYCASGRERDAGRLYENGYKKTLKRKKWH